MYQVPVIAKNPVSPWKSPESVIDATVTLPTGKPEKRAKSGAVPETVYLYPARVFFEREGGEKGKGDGDKKRNVKK